MSRTSKALAAPVRRFFNPRFESLATRLDSIEAAVNRLAPLVPSADAAAVAASAHEPSGTDFGLAQVARQAERLAGVDVSEHNREGIPPNFLQLTSQAASSAQCDDPKYLEWFRLLSRRDLSLIHI